MYMLRIAAVGVHAIIREHGCAADAARSNVTNNRRMQTKQSARVCAQDKSATVWTWKSCTLILFVLLYRHLPKHSCIVWCVCVCAFIRVFTCKRCETKAANCALCCRMLPINARLRFIVSTHVFRSVCNTHSLTYIKHTHTPLRWVLAVAKHIMYVCVHMCASLPLADDEIQPFQWIWVQPRKHTKLAVKLQIILRIVARTYTKKMEQIYQSVGRVRAVAALRCGMSYGIRRCTQYGEFLYW